MIQLSVVIILILTVYVLHAEMKLQHLSRQKNFIILSDLSV